MKKRKSDALIGSDAKQGKHHRISGRKKGDARKRLLAAILSLVFFLSAVITAMNFLPPASAPEISMTILSESVQEVGYGESAVYTIVVENIADKGVDLFELDISGVPTSWEAELSENPIDIPAHSFEEISLTVTAPTMKAAAEAEMNGGIDHVAAIGVRGGNDTIGTITILSTGSATVKRNGTTEALDSEGDIYSGDVVTVSGSAIISIDPSKLINNSVTYDGDIFILLSDAVIGFLKREDTAYMTVFNGEVSVWIPGGGGGGGVRGSDAPGVRGPSSLGINLSGNALLDEAFPGMDINAIIEFNKPPVEESLFFLDVTGEGTTVEVFKGEIEITNDDESIILEKYEQVTAGETEEIPDPGRVRAVVLEIETDGTSKEVIEVRGENILDVNDTISMPDMDGRSIYIIHTEEEENPEVRVTQRGTTGKGEYRTRYTSIDEYSTRSFQFSSSSTAGVDDIISIAEDMITVESEDVDKVYNLSIAYREVGEEPETFVITGVEISEEEQTIEVEDWSNLTGESDTVTFSEGDFTVPLDNGQSGDELLDKIEAKKTNEKKKEIPVFLWIGMAIVTIGIIAFLLFMGSMPQQMEVLLPEEEDEEGMDGTSEGENEGFLVPGEQALLKPDEEEDEEGRNGRYDEEVQEERHVRELSDELADKVMIEVENGESIFPLRGKCRTCGRNYDIKAPGAYMCTRCNTPFKIDENGSYFRAIRRRGTQVGRPKNRTLVRKVTFNERRKSE